MATKMNPKKHPKAEIQNPGGDPWTIHVNAKLVELESVKAVCDRKWGENRLITLVDSGLREKFWVQNSKIGQAMAAKDQARFDKAVDSMVRAYSVLETWADQEGIEPANDRIPRVEWEMQTGRTMILVRTTADALVLERERQDATDILSLEELEVILADEMVQEVMRLKAMIPTAKLVSYKSKGIEDILEMKDDLEPILSNNSTTETKFDVKQAERFKNGQIKQDRG